MLQLVFSKLLPRHLALFFGFIGTLSCCLYFPFWKLSFFAPYLVMLIYEKPKHITLWHAAIVGLFLDGFSSYSHLGIYAASYAAATYLILRVKHYFYKESLLSLPALCFVFSSISTLALFFLVNIFEEGARLTLYWFIRDILAFSIIDAAYAFPFTLLPFLWKVFSLPQDRDFKQERPI